MNAPTRVAGFVLGLAAVFGIALAVGDQVGPVGEPAAADSDGVHSGHGQRRLRALHSEDVRARWRREHAARPTCRAG